MKTLTMITRHGVSKDKITGYTLITSDYQTVHMDTNSLAYAISSGKIHVLNMDIQNGKLVSTNGALDKYTFINTQTQQVDGVARAVIIDRVEYGGKLVGYTAFTQSGTLVELSVEEAVAIVNRKLVSNGKIKHTEHGDIVSAIGGSFQLRNIEIEKAPKGDIVVKLLFFGSVVGTKAEYFGAIVSCTSATQMSKLNDRLSKSNASIIAETELAAGQSIRDSLGIKRFGVNGLYGVFDVSILEKLVSAGAKVSSKVGSITVSAIKYDYEKNADEAIVKLDNNWKVIGKNTSGSKAEEKVLEYTKKIIKNFGNIKLTK